MEKITTQKIRNSKLVPSKVEGSEFRKIAMLTAYDFPFARILDEAGVDIVLVGDSLGNVALGYKDTLPVTLEEMIIHTRAVSRAVKHAMVVADMPFGSFQKSPKEAVSNAIKFVKAGAEAVKIEGASYPDVIKEIIKAGIPVMGHVGFTPQSVNQLGGYKVQGKTKAEKIQIKNDAKKLEKAGCFAVVLEMVPPELAKEITKTLKIPTIGIGAGKDCDGQVLVTNDLIGLSEWMPSFASPKVNVRNIVYKAVKDWMRSGERA